MTVKLLIPGPPKPKERARAGAYGFYTPEATSAAEDAVAWETKQVFRKPLTDAISVDLRFYLPIPHQIDKRRLKKDERQRLIDQPHCGTPDLDNLVKLVLDGMNGIAWADDKQVYELTAVARYGLDPRTVVTVTEHRSVASDNIANIEEKKAFGAVVSITELRARQKK